MNDIYNILINNFTVFLLVMIRMSSLFVITPVFGRKSMPNYLKIGFAFFCTIVIFPLLGDIIVEYTNIFDFALIAIKEFLVGIIIGFVSYLVFTALYVAGQIIDVQLGFGMVNVLDPMQDIRVPLIGNFIYILSTLFFLLIDGQHVLIAALVKSYILLPVNNFVFDQILVNNMLSIFFETFVIGFKICMPILAASLLAEISLGILAKTVPQINVFVIGMPLKVIIGLITLILMIPMFIGIMGITFDKMYNYIYLIIKSMVTHSLLFIR